MRAARSQEKFDQITFKQKPAILYRRAGPMRANEMRPNRLRAGLRIADSLPHRSGRDSTFVVLHCYALACAAGNVIGVEAVHRAAVEMQADDTGSLRGHARDVDVVGVWDKAGDCAPAQENDAAAHEMNVFIRPAVRCMRT